MRTYSESEVSAIIERAVERQRAIEAGDSETGLTLDEIERLGREAGIDPAHLRAAAAEVDDVGRTLSKQTGQTRTHVYTERWLDTPFSIEGWEDVVAHLRSSLGAPMGAALGQASGETIQQIGRSFEWSHTSGLGVRTQVTVSPRGDRTKLRITQLVGLSSPVVEGVSYGGLIASVLAAVGGGVGAGALGSPSLALVIGLVTFVLAWAIAAPAVVVADRSWRARKLAALGTLADDLTPLLQSAADTETAEQDTVASSTGRLDLDALPDAPDEADTQSLSRNRIRG